MISNNIIKNMDLLKNRHQRDQRNQKLIQEVLKDSQTNRYQFGSLKEMITIRDLSLKQILSGKIKTEKDKGQTLQVLEDLSEYFYVEDLNQLDVGDYLRYFSFKTDHPEISFELKRGGYYINHDQGFIVLRNIKHPGQIDEKPSYWKISDKTPIFCRLNDQDKMILVLMERTSYQDNEED